MSEFVEIAIAMLELYAAVGVMCIGFGYMFAGKNGGARAAQFYFGRSLRWTGAHLRLLIRRVASLAWNLFVWWIVHLLAQGLLVGLRWLFARKAGWLSPWK
jgi:hypothetical protein